MLKRQFAHEILHLINEVRVNPMAHNQKFEVVKAGYSIVKNSPVPGEIDAYLKLSQHLKPAKPLSLSDGLCRQAENELKNFIEKKTYERGFDTVNVLKKATEFVDRPDNLLQIVESIPQGSIEIVAKLFFNPMDRERTFRTLINDNYYTKVGIAHAKINRDDVIVFIFCEKCLEKVSNDLSELKKAFDLFDVSEIGKIEPKEIVAAMKSLGYSPLNPIFTIMKELDSFEYSNSAYVDWDSFLNHINSRVEDTKSDEGLKRIFDLFIGNPSEQTITLSSLRRICNELGENKNDELLEDMIKRSSNNGEELTFEEFKVFMNKKYGDN